MKAKTSDIFALSRILSKMEIKPTVKDEKGNVKTQEQFGFDIFMEFSQNIYKAEKEIMELLARLFEKEIEELEDIEVFTSLLAEAKGELVELFMKATSVTR